MAISPTASMAADVEQLLSSLGVSAQSYMGGSLPTRSPISGELVAHVGGHSTAEARQAIDTAHNAFLAWPNVPAPSRGELVRLLGDELRTHKEALGRLVSIEVGKIISEQGRRSGAIQV